MVLLVSISGSVVSDSLWPHGLSPTRLLCAWNSPGKHIGVGCHSLLQGIFPTQVSNLALLHCRQILSHLSHQRSPLLIKIQNIIWSCFPCFKTRESFRIKYFSKYLMIKQSLWAKIPWHSRHYFLSIYFLIRGKLLYNVLVSATKQWESVTIIHVPAPWILPPLLRSHPSKSSQNARLGSLWYAATSH